ncbi:hypothetical protein AQUCO_08700006v1 [Aquilegia coerulea]|uniref:RanBP2-type domain-containing protein n=2 Tax=Aquilegia coerulea TaxID=218851 RepID=A0A2G5C6B4_AQUCA|nr:hypothetical protein AQUCO_08700006v1 [Aquilegia coerulea]
MGEGGGREGDWECGSCANRNYAFRSFCNRCKQPRLLVDNKTPADSKWLPRIGDWICTGCTNNNYASREKCKKCGQPMEVAAMPAFAIPGASLPTHAHYFARAQGAPGLRMNMGMTANSALHLPILPNSPWLLGNAEQHGLQPGPNWPISGSSSSGFAYVNHANPLVIPKGWRVGDWICNCGFHNYSSRAECKKCNASLPSSTISSIANKVTGLYQPHGTKRLASEEFFGEWDNKRLNAGDINNPFLTNQQHSYHKHEQIGRSNNDQASGLYPYPSGNTATSLNSQVSIQLPQLAPVPTLLGKGAKQWRDGDWMCTNCDNHNYASRSQCNRSNAQPLSHKQR